MGDTTHIGAITRVGAFALLCVSAGCGDSTAADAGNGGDASASSDAATDASAVVDAATTSDAATSSDGATADLGRATDGGGSDAAAAVGPTMELLGGAVALGTPVIDASPDEAGNLWVATPDALYIRRAGASAFRRYTNADGLHIGSVILSVAGGGPNDGYVGLMGIETGNENDAPEIRLPGKAEHVSLQQDGSITSRWYGDMHTDVSANYWITRSAYKLLYVHEGPAAGHVFMGGNHGITHIYNDQWGDHVHVEVFYEPDNSGTYGLWYGLAMDPLTGGLWTCGKNACGLQTWNPDPRAWVNGRYIYAFTVFTGDHGLEVPHGYNENFVGAAVTADGTAYFLSRTQGLAAWKPDGTDYQHIQAVPVPGLGTPVDVAADPDGSVWLAGGDRLLRLHPDSNSIDELKLPAGDLRRLYLDTRTAPRTLYISTGGGLVIYRGQ